MASTNKTANYNLSQFTATDKPAWIADYNQDMYNIDAGMKANADADASINATIESLSTKVDTVSATSQTNATNIATNTSDIATLQGTVAEHSTSIEDTKGEVATNSADITALKTTSSNNATAISRLQSTTETHSNDISNLKTGFRNLGFAKGYFAVLKANVTGITWKINGANQWSFVYISKDILGEYAGKTPIAQFATANTTATVPEVWAGLGVQDGSICFGAWNVTVREDLNVAVLWTD